MHALRKHANVFAFLRPRSAHVDQKKFTDVFAKSLSSALSLAHDTSQWEKLNHVLAASAPLTDMASFTIEALGKLLKTHYVICLAISTDNAPSTLFSAAAYAQPAGSSMLQRIAQVGTSEDALHDLPSAAFPALLSNVNAIVQSQAKTRGSMQLGIYSQLHAISHCRLLICYNARRYSAQPYGAERCAHLASQSTVFQVR